MAEQVSPWEQMMASEKTDPVVVTEEEFQRYEDIRWLAGMEPTPDDHEDWDIAERLRSTFCVIQPKED